MIVSARGTAPGKIILFGEHAVVHGIPAIAVPLSAVQVTVDAKPASPGAGLTIHAPDVGETVRATVNAYDNPLYDALLYPAQIVLRALERPTPDVTLTVRSTIPIASGLGSGAALATAIMRALSAALRCDVPPERLNSLVYEVEKRHHGTPSGIDNTVIVYEEPVYFVRDEPLETFCIGQPFMLLVVDSGVPSPTKVTVGDVGRLLAQDRFMVEALFKGVGDIVKQARSAIEAGTVEVLGTLMQANHAILQQLTVSSPLLDRLCAAAEEAGAAGAKLSGGGRGGNIIALVTPEQAAAVAEALTAAGAARVIQTTVQAPSGDEW
ncbi:MAG: mevalonate kinase [Anaerolineae bacterium]|nr:mevalonate kinase [Anaerolineae bacterium]